MYLLSEWLDENAHRQFPLADAASGEDQTGVFILPRDFMVDMVLNTPDWVDASSFYVSRVLVTSGSAEITVSYDRVGAPVVAGSFINIRTDADDNQEYELVPAASELESFDEFESMTGGVIIGRTDEIIKYPGEWTFTASAGELISSCVNKGVRGVRQLRVGDVFLTGKVRLVEGSGVTIETSEDSVSGESVITVSAGSSTSSGISIQNDSDIIDALVDRYGRPITTINNVPPDSNGNFAVRGVDCADVDVEEGAVVLSNPCAKPCCDPDIYFDDVYDTLNELNARCARITTFYNEVRNTLNRMQNDLIRAQIRMS